MKRVLGIGNALSDALLTVTDDELIRLGLPKGSTQFSDYDGYCKTLAHLAPRIEKWASGGSAGNAILALGNLRAKPGFIGKVGNDDPGHHYENNCLLHGITTHFLHDSLPSGVCISLVSPDGQRTMFDYLGAAANLTMEDIDSSLFANYDILHLEGYLVQNHDLIFHVVNEAKKAGLEISLDMGNFNIVAAEHTLFERLLKKTDIIFANEDEASAFCRTTDIERQLDILGDVCKIAVVKVGAKGAWVKAGDFVAHTPAARTRNVLDTTGAGDFFAAGFLWSYARQEPLQKSLERGAVLASRVIETMGTTLNETTWEELRTYFI